MKLHYQSEKFAVRAPKFNVTPIMMEKHMEKWIADNPTHEHCQIYFEELLDMFNLYVTLSIPADNYTREIYKLAERMWAYRVKDNSVSLKNEGWH